MCACASPQWSHLWRTGKLRDTSNFTVNWMRWPTRWGKSRHCVDVLQLNCFLRSENILWTLNKFGMYPVSFYPLYISLPVLYRVRTPQLYRCSQACARLYCSSSPFSTRFIPINASVFSSLLLKILPPRAVAACVCPSCCRWVILQ
jgi:hypothetical protein